MARKSKFNQQIAEKIIKYIASGYTLKDTAKAVGLSDETIRRWRYSHSDFNEQMVEASNYQWGYSKRELRNLHPSNRIYRRQKVTLSEDYGPASEKPLVEPLKPSKRQYMYGLPIRPCAPDKWEKTPKYYNSSSGMVEWIDVYPLTGRLTFHRCSLDVYERKKRERALNDMFPPFIAVV